MTTFRAHPRVVRPVRTEPVRTTLVLPAALHRRLRFHLIDTESGSANSLILRLLEAHLDGLYDSVGDSGLHVASYDTGYRVAMDTVRDLIGATSTTGTRSPTPPSLPTQRPNLPTAPPTAGI